MNEGTQVQTAESSTAAAPAADVSTSQPNLDNLTLEEMDNILYKGGKLVPLVGSEGETTDQVETPPVAAVEPAPGEQPAVDEPVVATAGEEVVETRSPEQILADQHAAVDAVVAAGGDEAAQQAAADAAALPVAPVEPAVEPEPEGIERARFASERDQLIVAHYKHAERAGKPISWAEAEARVDGPKTEEVKPEPAAPPVDHVAAVATIESEIAAIEAKLEGFEEGLYTKELANLTSELSAKRSELVFAKRDLQQAADTAQAARTAAAAASEANRTASHAQAIEEYPAVADDKTPLGKAVAKRVSEMKNPAHPDHAILFADSAPRTIAKMVADELGIAPVKTKTVSPPAKPTVTAPPRKLVAPAAGNKTAVVPGKPVEDAKARVAKLMVSEDLAELDAAFGAGDPSKLLVGAR